MPLLNKMLMVHRIVKQPLQVSMFRDILDYYGYVMTPEVALGVSLGIGFEYMHQLNFQLSADFVLPCFYIGGYFSKDRRKLSKNLRIWLDVYRGDEPEAVFKYLYNYLRMGRPVIVEVDLQKYCGFLKQHLPQGRFDELSYLYEIPNFMYLHGFMLTVVGYNDASHDIIALDAHLGEPVRIPRSLFNEMCFHMDELINVDGEWILVVVPRHKLMLNIEHAITDAIKQNVWEMLNPYVMDDGYLLGLPALKRFTAQVRDWSEMMPEEQLKTTIEMIYFNSEIEVGSTGLLRKNYAGFLEQSGKLLNNARLSATAELYHTLGEKWSRILGSLYSYSQQPSRDYKSATGDMQPFLEEVAELEEQAIVSLAEAVDFPSLERWKKQNPQKDKDV